MVCDGVRINPDNAKKLGNHPQNQCFFILTDFRKSSKIKYSQSFFIINQFFIFLQPSKSLGCKN